MIFGVIKDRRKENTMMQENSIGKIVMYRVCIRARRSQSAPDLLPRTSYNNNDLTKLMTRRSSVNSLRLS